MCFLGRVTSLETTPQEKKGDFSEWPLVSAVADSAACSQMDDKEIANILAKAQQSAAAPAAAKPAAGAFRIEKDTFGDIKVASDRYPHYASCSPTSPERPLIGVWIVRGRGAVFKLLGCADAAFAAELRYWRLA
jgi:hypothetical protein